MILCMLVFTCSLLIICVAKRKAKKSMGKLAVLCMGFSGVGFLAGYLQMTDPTLVGNNTLKRQENGAGAYEAELSLKVEGMEETTFFVSVPEQYLTKEEEQIYLEAAVSEIEKEFAGENTSVSAIRESVVIRTRYQEGQVCAEWSFSNPKLIEENGTIRESEMSDEGERIKASVLLECEDSRLIHEFYFNVYKKEKSEEEIIYGKIRDLISENGKTEGTEVLLLPTDVEGREVSWKNKESDIALQILFLGLVVILLYPCLERQRSREAIEKREAQLLREYPEMVNKLALLLGAGMTLQGAWNQITSQYKEARRKKQVSRCEAYEEMLITQREIESGKGEAKSYEAFGKRCGPQRYRKLSNYLIQNLRKGSYSICDFLEKEAAEVLDERRSMAQRYGEEMGTKLLLPMMLMLGIVIFIIMVPAVASFQVGA